MHAIASPNATNRAIQIQPGTETVPTGSTSTWDQPNAPPATSRIQRKNVLANVPFADMVLKPVAGVLGGASAVAVAVPLRAGAAQPGSSSSAVAENRFSLSTGLAIVPPRRTGGTLEAGRDPGVAPRPVGPSGRSTQVPPSTAR